MLAFSCRAAIPAPSSASSRVRDRRGGNSLVNPVSWFRRCELAQTRTLESTAQNLLCVASRWSPDEFPGANRGIAGSRQPLYLKRLRSNPGGKYERQKGLFRRPAENNKSSNSGSCGFENAEFGEGEGCHASGDAFEGSEKVVELNNERTVVEGFAGSETGTAKVCEGLGSEVMGSTVESKDVPQGTLLGAVALITGTSVGAGILALPARTGPAGFIPSAAVLGVCWGYLLVQALLMAEVNVGLMRQLKTTDLGAREIVSLRTMAEETLGGWGGNFVAGSYLLLSYTLIVAYIVKAEDVVSALLQMPTEAAALSFTLGLGSLLLFGGTKLIDWVNQMLTFGLLGSFTILVVGGASIGDWTRLERMDWLAAPASIPVVFLALVFHDLIPVLCLYLDGDMARVRLSLVAGSAVPLLMLLVWDGVAFSIAPVSGIGDPLDTLMRSGAAGPVFLVQVFALLAVATSFIGSYLGMFEFSVEQLGKLKGKAAEQSALLASVGKPKSAPTSPSKATSTLTRPAGPSAWIRNAAETHGRPWTRFLSFVLVLAPPLAISLAVPTSAFLSASDIAGAYGMTALYGIFPPLMAWNFAKKRNEGQPRRVLEGKVALAGLSACATGVLLLQLAGDMSFLSGGPPAEIIVASSQDNPVVLCTYNNNED